MSNQLKHHWRKDQFMVLGLLCLIFLIFTTIFSWTLGIIGLVVLLAVMYWIWLSDIRFEKNLETYIATLSHRVKKVGDEALLEMPLGIVLYSEQYSIDWMNPYMTALTGGDSFMAHSLGDISEMLIPLVKGDNESEIIKLGKRRYRVLIKRQERLLYIYDVTETLDIRERYKNEQTVFSIIFLDNYDEVTQGMDDQLKSNLNNEMTAIIKDWALENNVFLKRYSSDKFFGIMNLDTLKELEKKRFNILDKVREATERNHVSLTLSIGAGAHTTSLIELGQLSQSALDLALGRGGDQAVIKEADGKVRFYGGKSNPIEKRTRVRARVISHALSELIHESDEVMVMGHQTPDMDAIGACIGIMKIVEANQKRGSIVLEKDKSGAGVQKLIEAIKEREELWAKFISPEEAVSRSTEKTLIVVVDTHKPSMVIEPKLLTKAHRVMVMDHHRRGEEFIKDPVLVYMEPYASSTAELVTELLEYQPNKLNLGVVEATAMLAGITVDTKSFTLRTGSRTFDAASYLRAHGADTVLVQKLLREDLEHFNRRAALIQTTELYQDNLAIAVGDDGLECDQVLIAQAADTLLSMEGVKASFVISKRNDGRIGVSARSLGEVNVQLIMEAMGGGGHLTNAATQFDDSTTEEVKEQVKLAIDDYFKGGEPS